MQTNFRRLILEIWEAAVFSNQKPAPSKPLKKVSPARDSAVTILTSGCHFSGKLYCRGSSRIGGRIEGKIVSEGLLIVEEAALITADIHADEAVIQGRVKGTLEATGRVELTSSSIFEGDIKSPVLVVNEGATFNGRASMPVEASQESSQELFKHVNGGVDHAPKADPELSSVLEKTPEVAMVGER